MKIFKAVIQAILTPLMLLLIGCAAIAGLLFRLYEWVWEDI